MPVTRSLKVRAEGSNALGFRSADWLLEDTEYRSGSDPGPSPRARGPFDRERFSKNSGTQKLRMSSLH